MAAGQDSISYLGGKVLEIQDWGKDGMAAIVYNAQSGMTEVIAEFSQTLVKVGDMIAPGQAVGSGANEVTGVTHYELHKGEGRTRDTVDPLQYLNSRGIDPEKGIIPGTMAGGATAANPFAAKQETDAEKQRKKEEADRQRLIQQARANEDQGLQLQRQADADKRKQESASRRLAIVTANQNLAGTPFEAAGQRSLTAFDLRDKFQQEIDQKKQELEDLKREASRLDTRKGEPGIDAVIDGYKRAIAQTDAYIKSLGEQYQQESKNLELSNAQAVAQNEIAVRAEMSANRTARAQQTMSLETEAFLSAIKDPTLQAFLRTGFEAQAKSNSYADQINKINEEASKLEEQIKAVEASGLGANMPELGLMREKLADLRDTAIELQSNADLEFKVSVTGQTELLEQLQTSLTDQATNARVNRLQQRGDTFGANALQRQAGRAQIEQNFTNQRTSIMALKGTAQEGQIPGLLSQLEEVRGFSLEGINNEFLTLGQTMEQTAQGALKGFLSDLGKGKSLAESLTGALDNLAGSLLDMVLNQAFSAIFKGVGAGIGGGLNLGDMSTPLYYAGNVPNFAGGNAIGDAFKREKSMGGGGKPYLAVLNDRELILSAKQSERFMSMGLNKVVNLAGGNTPTANKAGMGGISLNMPMNLSIGNDGGGGGGKGNAEEFASGLQAKMQAIAFAEIAKARRPNGMLWNAGMA